MNVMIKFYPPDGEMYAKEFRVRPMTCKARADAIRIARDRELMEDYAVDLDLQKRILGIMLYGTDSEDFSYADASDVEQVQLDFFGQVNAKTSASSS